MLAALLKVPLLLKAKTFYMGEMVPLNHIIDKLNLYAEWRDDNSALIRVAGCLLHRMNLGDSSELAHMLPATALSQAPQAMVGAGEPLEWLVHVCIVLFIKLSCCPRTSKHLGNIGISIQEHVAWLRAPHQGGGSSSACCAKDSAKQ
jgi:hypothetical protein